MACRLVWTPKALQTYLQNDAYLQEHWPEFVREKFNINLKDKFILLKQFPTLGRKSKTKNIHKTLVHKRILLYYRYKPKQEIIELLYFWNTSKDDKKLPEF